MRLSFVCNFIELNGGWSPFDTRLGGSEEMIVETAKRLAKDHTVKVFHNGRHGISDGVEYKPHSAFTDDVDLAINMNSPNFKCNSPQILWTTLSENKDDLSHFKAVCVISKFAKENTGVVHDMVRIVPPGYDQHKIKRGDKIPKQCLYASSPDRGLNVLYNVWPKVYKEHPDATLIVTYKGELDLPGVICLGDVDEDTMNELYATSDLWLHPCTGIELYCMTGVKAQVAGCYPVVIPHMALAETVKFGTKSTLLGFANDTIRALNGHPDVPELEFPNWDDVTKKLMDVIRLVGESQDTK